MSTPREAAAGEAPRRTLRSATPWLVGLATVALWIWWQGAEQRALRNLPAPERAALYERTLSNIERVCASSDHSLDQYCREQARILLELPECDAGCRERSRAQIGRP